MPASDDERIRRGLDFLSGANRRVVKAAVQIAKLLGTDNPPGVGDLLSWYQFEVEGNPYGGRMTQEQNDYLEEHQDSLLEFANAVADIILNQNDVVVETLRSLNKGLAAPQKAAKAAGEAGESPLEHYVMPPLGCCRYDTNQQRPQVIQSYCEGPLAGTWVEGPCPSGKLPSEKKKSQGGDR